jgi:hypothetical protein
MLIPVRDLNESEGGKIRASLLLASLGEKGLILCHPGRFGAPAGLNWPQYIVTGFAICCSQLTMNSLRGGTEILPIFKFPVFEPYECRKCVQKAFGELEQTNKSKTDKKY